MRARPPFVVYHSPRVLRGLRLGALGEVTYLDYAKALYTAYRGDTAGAGYNLAIAAAGPIAAIGSAIATFANRAGKKDDAMISAFVDAMVAIGFGQMLCGGGKTGTTYPLITPDGARMLDAGGDAILQVARAIGNSMPADFVAQKFREWLATARPAITNAVCHVVRPPREIAAPSPIAVVEPTPAPVVSAAPLPAPTPSPVPAVFTSAPVAAPLPVLAPAPVAAPTILPAMANAPAITVNLPASVPPDQTPELLRAALAQGASTQQAMLAAFQSLAARQVPTTPAVVNKVSQDVATLQSPSRGVILLAAGAVAVIFLGAVFSRG